MGSRDYDVRAVEVLKCNRGQTCFGDIRLIQDIEAVRLPLFPIENIELRFRPYFETRKVDFKTQFVVNGFCMHNYY